MGVQHPTISVIVPIYNVERFLDQALCSIEAQTLRDIEIICVNDGSTDRSPEVMRAHAERDERIRMIDKPNGGYGSACNCGIDAAQGEWIAIVEPDDWIEPAMFADMTAFASSFDTPIDIVKTPYWRVVDPDTPAQRFLNCSYKGRIRPAQQPFAITDKGVDHLLIHHPSIWSALYRAGFLKRCEIRFREIPGAGWADNPFLVETLCQTRAIAYLDQPYYCYREETDEKSAAFAKGSASVPFDRWHDMMNILDRLEVKDERVLRTLVRRGFTYLDYIIGIPDADQANATGIMKKMFARMDDDLVLTEPNISPAWKARYRQVKGLAGGRDRVLPYAASLIAAGFYTFRNIGPSETIKVVEAVFKRDETAASLQVREEDIEAADGLPNAKISLVIPVFNGSRFLTESFKSIARQTYQNYEAICVDDGSTDDSADILARLAAADDRISVIKKENGGPSSARNAGIAQATGDYIVFLDCDDLLEPNACQRIAAAAGERAYDSIVFGWSCFPEGEENDWLRARTNVRDAVYGSFEPALVFDEMTNPYLRIAVRREFLNAQGVLFDEALRVGEDAAFLFDLLPRARATRLVSDKLYRYRMPHDGSIMSTSRDGTPEKCLDDLNMMISIFGSWSNAGLLEPYGAQLVHWYVSFLLYTILRQPEPVRSLLAALSRELLTAHFSTRELSDLGLPKHDLSLIRVLWTTSADGSLALSKPSLTRKLLAWRVAEYGIADLFATARKKLVR